MAISAALDELENPISLLQVQAWEAANTAYLVSDGEAEAYRAYARELYEEDLHERVLALFARLDEQNAQVEAALLIRDTVTEQAVRGRGSEETFEARKLSRGIDD